MERNELSSLSFIACLLLLAAACTRSALSANGNYFLAPTLAGNSTPVLLETHTPPPATATAECENHLVFLRDITVPDGTHFAQGETIEKSWEIRNEGTCPWVRGYFVQLENGPSLGAIERQPLPEAEPGEAVVLTIQFKAPNVPGNYRSSWKAHDFGERPFGVLFYVDIVVD